MLKFLSLKSIRLTAAQRHMNFPRLSLLSSTMLRARSVYPPEFHSHILRSSAIRTPMLFDIHLEAQALCLHVSMSATLATFSLVDIRSRLWYPRNFRLVHVMLAGMMTTQIIHLCHLPSIEVGEAHLGRRMLFNLLPVSAWLFLTCQNRQERHGL
jgi:hypothetical protein